jgi:DNA sulfur modification protein DndB
MLNPTEGYVVAGVAIDEHTFVGRMRAAQLLKIAEDPRASEDARKRAGSERLEDLHRIRLEVQRLFEGAKAKNVVPYTAYIVALHEGQDGMTPAIILYSREKLVTVGGNDGAEFAQIPWDAQLVAIDGETQLAARFDAANLKPETKNDFVPVVICHDRPLEWARQVFHDLNLLSVRPNAAVGIGMDQRDVLTRVARAVEDELPFFKGRVNKVRRQLRRSDKEVVTITALRGACVTFAEGISGVRHGAKPVSLPRHKFAALNAGATEWFGAVAKAIGTSIEDRDRTIASSPAVLAAIGAMGHELLEISDTTQRATELARRIDMLKAVNWDRGAHWEGIAGKLNPKGSFSVGGSKETAYAIYTALTDPESNGYKRVHRTAAAA